MRKFLIIGGIIVLLIAVVSIYSCQTRKPASEPQSKVGGIYTGAVVAVGQNPDGTTTIYWDKQKPVTVRGWYQLAVGQVYVLNIVETKNGLEITGIQIKK